MRSRSSTTRLPSGAILLSLFLGMEAPAAAEHAPVAVAPGDAETLSTVPGSCPTFHWTAIEGAREYHLLVLPVGEPTDYFGPEEVVLDRRFPAGTTGWTPTLESCLDPGAYAWLVRAETEVGASAWSEALLFEVSERTALAHALRLLESSLGTEAAKSLLDALRPTESTPPEPEGNSRSRTRTVSRGVESGGVTGLRAFAPSSSGAAYGVSGTSSSPSGAGLRAENTQPGGADLLLEGLPPALVTEAGLVRDARTDVAFDFTNPGDGGMTLRVEGVDVVTTATDKDTLAKLPCVDGQIAKRVVGAWTCSASSDFVAAAGDAMTGKLTIDVPSGFALQTATGDDIDVGGDVYLAGERVLLHRSGDNLGVGIGALSSVAADGTSNTAIGDDALAQNLSGDYNTAVGRLALTANTTGLSNTAAGVATLQANTTGHYNTAVGRSAMADNTEGSNNTALGGTALWKNITGNANTAIGSRTLWSNTDGSYNVAVGLDALLDNVSGENNIAIGERALAQNTTGSSNIAIGSTAGYATIGSQNIVIGHGGVLYESNRIRIGTSGTHTATFLVGDVGIETSPSNRLHVRDSINGAASVPNHVAQIENAATGNSPDVLVLKIGYTGVAGNGINFISFVDGNGASLGAIQGNAAGGVELAGPGSDYAEWLPKVHAGEALEPGDVLGLHGDRVSKRTARAARVMVVSSGPIVAGNDPGEGRRDGHVRVAFVGQAPVKVRGLARAGDVIVASDAEDGTAVAVDPGRLTASQAGLVVGRALVGSDEPGVKPLRTLVGLPDPEPFLAPLLARLAEREAELRDLQVRLARLDMSAKHGNVLDDAPAHRELCPGARVDWRVPTPPRGRAYVSAPRPAHSQPTRRRP